MSVAPFVHLTQVSRSFQEGGSLRPVLAGVDLEVAAGEMVALVGRSGSGKSTLLNLIGGLDLPDGGRVEVGGVDIARVGERERTLFRRRHIGFVYQFFNLIPTLTVAENVALPLELNHLPAAEARVAALLEAVGLGDRAASFPDRLSGGEQQRVALARALAHRPGLVLADEPTGNLDAESGRAVTDLLRDLVREQGATLILVTHDQELAATADRVVTLAEGRLV